MFPISVKKEFLKFFVSPLSNLKNVYVTTRLILWTKSYNDKNLLSVYTGAQFLVLIP